jgi:Asp-tRNA(Asn)/Glu-tRNA(Gln) amidotransferase A subunit family amidase
LNSQIQGAVRSCYLAGALPGGSSGGSGVSSGAYLTHFTFGGETGGSIRNPSDRSALVGWQGERRLDLGEQDHPARARARRHRPMTRSAIDNAVIRDVVGKKDPGTSGRRSCPFEDRRPVRRPGSWTRSRPRPCRGRRSASSAPGMSAC